MEVFQGERDTAYPRAPRKIAKGVQNVMVDHSARAYAHAHTYRSKSELDAVHTAKLESMLARTYTDDADMRRGIMAVPRNQFRPGQRDDDVRCSLTALFPV